MIQAHAEMPEIKLGVVGGYIFFEKLPPVVISLHTTGWVVLFISLQEEHTFFFHFSKNIHTLDMSFWFRHIFTIGLQISKAKCWLKKSIKKRELWWLIVIKLMKSTHSCGENF